MSDDIGVHLLGRVPSPPDDRDYKLADYLPKPEVLPDAKWDESNWAETTGE